MEPVSCFLPRQRPWLAFLAWHRGFWVAGAPAAGPSRARTRCGVQLSDSSAVSAAHYSVRGWDRGLRLLSVCPSHAVPD
jgi:hypothetical protein